MNRNNLLPKIFLTFAKIGAFTFGGGYAMLPLIQEEVVTKKGWVSELEFYNAVAIAQSTPGILAVNTAIYLGNHLAGLQGTLVATLGVTLPSFLIILGVSIFFNQISTFALFEKVLTGIRPAVVSLIAYAGFKMAKIGLADRFGYFLAIAIFISQFFLKLNLFLSFFLLAFIGTIYYKIKQNNGGQK